MKQLFDEGAVRYDAAYDDDAPGGHVLRARMAAALELAGVGPGTALDAGMGSGRLCEQLSARGWTVFGIDVSPSMVSLARERLQYGGDDRLRVATIDRLPFDDASFDLVTATGVLEYSERLLEQVREIARVLRPGGAAVLSIPNLVSLHALSRRMSDPVAGLLRRGNGRRASRSPHGARLPRPQILDMIARGSGLEVSDVRYVGTLVVPAPIDRLAPRSSARLARSLESTRRPRRSLATQVVLAARAPQADGSPAGDSQQG